MIDRGVASTLGYGQASGDQLVATVPVPAGYHWIVTMVSVWRTVIGSLNSQNYDTIGGGIFVVPPGIALPIVGFQQIQPPQLIHVPKNMDFFFEGVPELRGATGVSRARMDAIAGDGIILPSLSILAAIFNQVTLANPIQPGNAVMSFQYAIRKNC